MSEDQKIIKKKVSPYPFSASLTFSERKIQGEILKLVAHGFLMDCKGQVLKVGDIGQVQFEIPVNRDFVTTSVRVIKTYDHVQVDPNVPKRIAELHFLKLSDTHFAHIDRFLKQIKQLNPGAL